MEGNFYVVGTGPGDPELLTLRAVRVLKDSKVWLVPAARQGGESIALNIIRQVVDGGGREIINHHFPMIKVFRGEEPDPEVSSAWREAAELIMERLHFGKDVAFPTMGDPSIYSTAFYICETLSAIDPGLKARIIPGISAMGASAASVGQPLCSGDERMALIPATFAEEELREILERFESVVLMKVHKALNRIVPLLDELNLLDKAVLVERTGLKEERIYRDLHAALKCEQHYFSTMIVRK